jgi:hypothetical protein
VNVGSNFSTAGYYKDGLGVVHLKGLVMSGGADPDTAVFTLPAGYTPPESMFFTCMSNNALGVTFIASSGQVMIRTGSNVSFCLDGITFKAA